MRDVRIVVKIRHNESMRVPLLAVILMALILVAYVWRRR